MPPLIPSEIATERLTLTPLAERDADDMVGVLADVKMHEFTGGRPRTLEELRVRYDQLAAGHSADGAELWFNWIVRLGTELQPVGVMQATVAADGTSAEVAWEVGVPWQRRGIASEAARAVVDWLTERGVPLITSCIRPDHVASARVATRAGLVRTRELVDGEEVWRLPGAASWAGAHDTGDTRNGGPHV